MTISQVTSEVITWMIAAGIPKADIKDSTRTHTRRRLETEFGSSLHITNTGKRKTVLLYSDHLTMDEVIYELHAAKEQISLLRGKTSDVDMHLHQAAIYVRSAIKEYQVSLYSRFSY